MPIEANCKNVAGFDSDRGEYLNCNQKIRVADKFAGKSVKCPKCSQPIEIPFAAAPDPKKNANKDEAYRLQADIMDMEFKDDQNSIASAGFVSGNQRCPKCGGYYTDDGICTSCNYMEPVKKAQRERKVARTVKPAGFQLWLTKLANEPKTTVSIGYFLLVASTLACLLFIAAGILSVSILGVVIAVLAAFMLVFVWSVFFRTSKLAKDPDAGLGFLAPFWNGVLSFSRSLDWQKYDSRFEGRKILDLRGKTVADIDLAGVEGFKNAQVLDLEGCEITDNGLKHLYGHQHLHCLVLKNTKVTPQGVGMLQQALPRIWIWH